MSSHLMRGVSALLLIGLFGVAAPGSAADPVTYDVFEKSIADLQSDLAAGRVTSRQLVEAYLARINAYDQAGPKLNAIVSLNPKALAEADALDKERAARKLRGPLHGIPVLVKDNYDTVDMPTSAGTLALATLQPEADATQVKRLKAAGAIILGKTTMHELAAGITTVSSLTGQTHNPYDPARVPGGSSGGTGASIAASFAAAGMGSDTCGSIRIPSAYQNLVGMRETLGLSSRAGIVPLSHTQDVGGPLARSVSDLAIMLDATVGADPADGVTAGAHAHIPKSYRDALKPDGLKGARIGVIRALFGKAPEDREVNALVDGALKKMKEQGAEVMDVEVPGLEALLRDSSVILYEFKYDLADYLAKHDAPVKSLGEIIDRGLEHDQLESRLRERDPDRRDEEAYRKAQVRRRAVRDLVLAIMEENKLDAFAYPTTERKAPLIVESNVGGGSSCQLSATTGLPAMAIPVGFTEDELPIGMELLGAPFTEQTLLNIGYGWEQTAKPRRAPYTTPRLVDGHAPGPLSADLTIAAATLGGPSAHIAFTYDTLTSTLAYDARVSDLGGDKVVAVTLQRGTPEKPGPVLAQLLRSGKTAAKDALVLRARDRADLTAGRLFVHFYTQQAPLGVGRRPLRFAAAGLPQP